MKNYVRFLLALAQRAPVSDNPTDALSTRAVHDIGCYALDTTYPQTLTFNTPSACSQECEEQGHTVFAVRGQSCMCLDSMPSDDMKADASTCDVQCPGFPTEKCGGAERGYYSVGEIDTFTNTTTNTSSADADSFTYSATLTTTQTSLPTASGASSNSASSATSSAASSAATPTGSASGTSSAASPSSTVESTNAAGPMFDTSLTVVSSLVGAVALVAALI